MAEYKAIHGTLFQHKTSDPLTGGGIAGGAWASGGNLNQARYSIAGAGTQTAGLAFGGYSAPSRRNETEETPDARKIASTWIFLLGS